MSDKKPGPDTNEIIASEIHDTLEKGKALRDENPQQAVTAEHFHSYEYLVSLLARNQALSNRANQRTATRILVLTVAMILIGFAQVGLAGYVAFCR